MTSIKKYYAVIIFSLWSVFLTGHHYVLGPLSYLRSKEEFDGHLSRIIASSRQWIADPLSTFNPYIAGGYDRLAGDTYLAFSNLLYIFFPVWGAVGVLLFVQLFLPAYFTHRLLKDRFGVDNLSALAGGFAVTLFSGSPHNWFNYVTYRELSLAALPMLLWVMYKLNLSGVRGASIAFLLGGMYAFSGLFVLTVFGASLIVLGATLILKNRFWESLVIGIAFAVGTLAVESLPILAIKQISYDSTRAFMESESGSRIGLVRFVFKDSLYILVPIFALLVFFRRWPNSTTMWMFSFFVLYTFILDFAFEWIALSGVFDSVFDLSNATPRFYYAGKVMFGVVIGLLLFNISGLAAQLRFRAGRFYPEYECTQSSQEFRFSELLPIYARFKPGTFTMGIRPVLVLSVTFVAFISWKGLNYNYKYYKKALNGVSISAYTENPELVALSDKIDWRQPYRVVTVPETVDSNYRRSNIVPIRANHLAYYGLETLDGLNLLFPIRFHALWRAVRRETFDTVVDGNHPLLERRVFQDNYAYLQSTDHMLSKNAKRGGCALPDGEYDFDERVSVPILSMYGVKYIVSQVPMRSTKLTLLPSKIRNELIAIQCENAVTKIKRQFDGEYVGPVLYVYENLEAFPRAFSVGNVAVSLDQMANVTAISQADELDLRKTAYVSQTDFSDDTLKTLARIVEPGSVTILSRGYGKYTIEVSGTSDTLVIVSEHFRGPWSASIGAEQVKLFPVDHALIGMVVPKGKHIVELIYRNSIW